MIIFFSFFLKWNINGNKCEKGMFPVSNPSPSFIHRFEKLKLTFNQKKKKSGLRSQTYFCTKVIPLSRIRTLVFSMSETEEIQFRQSAFKECSYFKQNDRGMME